MCIWFRLSSLKLKTLKFLIGLAVICEILLPFTVMVRELDETDHVYPGDNYSYSVANATISSNFSFVLNTVKAKNKTELWVEKRQELLAASGGVRKLYLFAYMRGGSTLLGQVFNQDPSTIYWYEPLNMFYSVYFGMPVWRDTYDIIYYNHTHLRNTTPWEDQKLVNYFRSIFECKLLDLPSDVMASDFLANSQASQMQPYLKCYRHSLGVMGKNKNWGQLCSDQSGSGAFCGAKVTQGMTAPLGIKQCAMAQLNQCPQIIQTADLWLQTYSASNRTMVNFLAMLRNMENVSLPLHYQSAKQMNMWQAFLNNAKCKEDKLRNIRSCITSTQLEKSCSKATVRAAKVLRLKFMNFLPIIEGLPDLSVIHYIRDPRAIAHSKIKMYNCKPADSCLLMLTTRLCREIMQDINDRLHLEQQYPGVFLQIRYEDLVLNPEESVTKMFEHIGQRPHVSTLSWIRRALRAKAGNDKDPHGVLRTDGVAHIDEWRRKYKERTLQDIAKDSVCQELFSKLNYTLV